MAKKKLSLAEDPIGARFDRCVAKNTPRLGERGARAVCAASLNRAHPGALAAARRKADALRAKGELPPRAKRGSKPRTGPMVAGDLRRGDRIEMRPLGTNRGPKLLLFVSSTPKVVKQRGKRFVKFSAETTRGRGGLAMKIPATHKVRVLPPMVVRSIKPASRKAHEAGTPRMTAADRKAALKFLKDVTESNARHHAPRSGPTTAVGLRKGDTFCYGRSKSPMLVCSTPRRTMSEGVYHLTFMATTGTKRRRTMLTIPATRKIRLLVRVGTGAHRTAVRYNPVTIIRPEAVRDRDTSFNPLKTLGLLP